MKWSEIEKKATEKGWILAKHGKRHDIYLHPDHDEPLVMERHQSQEVKKGLLNKLKKQIGF